ncbi:MAG: tetratricopeptide repeat protein [Bryobacteraceae bacterium]|nr:tetratricopeptide repeat protein [Bryobacteraceae bacterium]
MDRATRKELKSDRFAQEVGHTVEYVSEHKNQVVRYGAIGLAVILLAAGIYFYRNYTHGQRQAALRDAIQISQGTVGPAQSPLAKTFNTQQEKDTAAEKAFADVIAKFPGSDEAIYSAYMIGNIAVDNNRMADAEKRYREVIDSGHADYASIARLSLAEYYAAQGKYDDAEKLLRPLLDKPTTLVSKEMATIALGRVLAQSKPDEARKLLEPLRTSDRLPISRLALTELSAMQNKK